MNLKNKTKIIATLGPSSQTEQEILALIEAGMDVARINLSHGDRNSHAQIIKTLKQTSIISGKDTAILLDTRGPEIRVGDLSNDLLLTQGSTIFLCSDKTIDNGIYVDYANLTDDAAPGSFILLDDGKIRLQVLEAINDVVKAKVIVGGILTSRKRVSLPEINVNLPAVTDKDIADIIFGVQQEVDFIAASFVRRAD
ncbi:MAG: pyruvate kinase, partial [Deltaproteobacteria bacterium]|nr:pyruvate kinase [Deltaproteobacteria bacterium]